MSPPGPYPPVDQSGRPLGQRAQETRQRLLTATHELLNERGVRAVSVAEITRRVGSSPATFYQYFKDVEEAVLELARQAADAVPRILAELDGPVVGPAGLVRARRVAEAFIRHWDAHRPVLLFRNLAADQGDERFRRVRIAALYPVVQALAAKVDESRKAGRVAREIDPHAAAAALASMLERLAAHHHDLEHFGTTREQLIETCARIVQQTAAGSAAD